jgi:hypothetical protein
MKKICQFLFIMAGIAGIACLIVSNALAQDSGMGGFGGGRSSFGGGNFDPTQFQQQIQQARIDNYRVQLEVTNEAQWTLIKEKIQKVLDAKQEPALNPVISELSGLLGMFGRGMNSGNPGARLGSTADTQTGGMARRNLTNFGIALSPEEEALQKAVDTKASNLELKTAQAKVIEARKSRQAKLEKEQEELRKMLTLRQQAIAMLNGLL